MIEVVLHCPLCEQNSFVEYFSAYEKSYGNSIFRQYFQCQCCDLVFLNPKQRVTAGSEKKRYLEHKNEDNNTAYCDFLLKAWDPIKYDLPLGARGLDYGCGPNPVLSKLIQQQGYDVEIYDPYFFAQPISGPFDFIVSTEVIEHVFDLNTLFKTLKSLLKKEGVMSLMTEFNPGKEFFKKWNYRQDRTHVCFFSKQTFHFICQSYGFQEIYCDEKRVIVLKR